LNPVQKKKPSLEPTEQTSGTMLLELAPKTITVVSPYDRSQKSRQIYRSRSDSLESKGEGNGLGLDVFDLAKGAE